MSSNPADTVVSLTAVADLDVGLTAAADPVEAGDPVAWTITAQNLGNTELTGVALDAADDSDCDEETVPTTIGVGATVTIECETPTADLLSPFDRRAVVTNQATVTTNETEPESSPEVEVDVVPPATGWTDVADWYRTAADRVDHWDLADGFAGGTEFRGRRPTSRGQFVRMVYRLAGEPTPPSPPTHSFTDVPTSLRRAVAWAAHDPDGTGPLLRLVSGLSATRFGPYASLSRGQTASVLHRLADRLDL